MIKSFGKINTVLLTDICTSFESTSRFKLTKETNYKPGFLLVEVDDTSINVTNYIFTQNIIIKENKFKNTLKKKVF